MFLTPEPSPQIFFFILLLCCICSSSQSLTLPSRFCLPSKPLQLELWEDRILLAFVGRDSAWKGLRNTWMDGWMDGWLLYSHSTVDSCTEKEIREARMERLWGEIQAGMIMVCRLGTSTCFQKTKPFDPKMWCQQLRVPIRKKLDFLDYGPNETSCRAIDWVW